MTSKIVYGVERAIKKPIEELASKQLCSKTLSSVHFMHGSTLVDFIIKRFCSRVGIKFPSSGHLKDDPYLVPVVVGVARVTKGPAQGFPGTDGQNIQSHKKTDDKKNMIHIFGDFLIIWGIVISAAIC